VGKRLQNTEIARFTRDGFLFPIRAYSSEDMTVRLNWLQDIEASKAGRIPPASNAKIHLLVPWLWDMVHDARIVDSVEDLIGPNLACWGTSFITKNGPDVRHVTWHQDATHWRLTAPRAVTAWLAFTPSTRANGCVRMIPRSNHRVLQHEDSRDELNMLGRRERVVDGVNEEEAVDIALSPGEMSLHDPLVVHGSDPNLSATRRIGFAIRYIPAGVHHLGAQRNSVTVVRGGDFGNFEHEIAPEGLFHADAVLRHKRALRLGMELIFGDGEKR
jgi:hypothetical protein